MLKLDDRDLLWVPHVFVENFGLRPSQFWTIREMYFHQKFGSCTKGKGTALDLISSSEAWLNDNGIEKDTINILNGWLQKFGIRVGMSESEILKALDEFHLKTLESPVSENESSK